MDNEFLRSIRKGAPTRKLGQALRQFVEDNPDAVDGIVLTLYELCVKHKNLQAIQFVFERLEGKTPDKISIKTPGSSSASEVSMLAAAIRASISKDKGGADEDIQSEPKKGRGRPKKV